MHEVDPRSLTPSYQLQPRQASRALAWAMIVISVVLLSVSNWRQSRLAATKSATATTHVAMPLELIGRYSIGVHSLMSQAGTSDTTSAPLIAQLDHSAVTAADKLAVVPIIGELSGKQAALDRLSSLHASVPPVNPDDARALTEIYASGTQPVTPESRVALVDHLGWFGKLALASNQSPGSAERQAVISSAVHTVITMVIGFGVIGIGMLAGLILLIILMIRLADRKLPAHYVPTSIASWPQTGGIFLEAFAIYLGGLTAALLGSSWLPHSLHNSLLAHLALMLVPTILAIAWPRVRGVDVGTWRYALGWHVGRGFFREIAMGLVGYLAGLPILAIGFIITAVLITLSHAHPSHPIQDMLGGSFTSLLLVYGLASVYAPITEETLFRGAFFHALRTRHGWWLSALVTAFIFACIHPQGWSTIPVLMSIAIVFAGIREWRGTILSSAAAHCLHNSAVVTFAIFAMR